MRLVLELPSRGGVRGERRDVPLERSLVRWIYRDRVGDFAPLKPASSVARCNEEDVLTPARRDACPPPELKRQE